MSFVVSIRQLVFVIVPSGHCIAVSHEMMEAPAGIYVLKVCVLLVVRSLQYHDENAAWEGMQEMAMDFQLTLEPLHDPLCNPHFSAPLDLP